VVIAWGALLVIVDLNEPQFRVSSYTKVMTSMILPLMMPAAAYTGITFISKADVSVKPALRILKPLSSSLDAFLFLFRLGTLNLLSLFNQLVLILNLVFNPVIDIAKRLTPDYMHCFCWLPFPAVSALALTVRHD